MSPSQRTDIVIGDIPVTFLDVLCATREYAPVHIKHGLPRDSAVLAGITHCLAIRGYKPTPYLVYKFVDAIKDVPWTRRASA